MINIEFYTTVGCHLCEEAAVLYQPFVEQGIIQIDSIDIAESSQLVELYGIRIPVLKRLDNNAELGWPFDMGGLKDYLSN